MSERETTPRVALDVVKYAAGVLHGHGEEEMAHVLNGDALSVLRACVERDEANPSIGGIPVAYTEGLENADSKAVVADMWRAAARYWQGEQRESAAEVARLRDENKAYASAFVERSNGYEDLNAEHERALEKNTQLEAGAERLRERLEGAEIRRSELATLVLDQSIPLRSKADALATAAGEWAQLERLAREKGERRSLLPLENAIRAYREEGSGSRE